MKTEVITNKWNKTGLLNDAKSKNDKNLLASNLERAALKLLKVKDEPRIREIKAGLFLPIVAGLFYTKKLRVIKNIHPLWLKFNKFFDKNYQVFQDLTKFHDIDPEAEFCAMFTELYERL